MNEAVDFFLRHIQAERGLAKNTCLAYYRDVKAFAGWCGKKKKDLLSADGAFIEEYLWHLKSDLKLKPVSIFRKAEAVRAFYRFLILEGKLSKDPTGNFRTPKLTERVPRTVSKKDISVLLSFPGRDGFARLRTIAIIEMLYATGMRISELLSLRLESFNMEQGWARVFGKGGKERIIPVHKKAVEVISGYLEARQAKFGGRAVDDVIFVNRSGRKLSRICVWKDIQKLAKTADVREKIHPHLFRHTFASHLLESGADLRSIQEMLGHASLNTTQIYTHVEKSRIKAAHEKYHPGK
ncbi:MAG: tyrosine recombinase [Elusimicrobia bacterium]|nr:tyrosine recombinase [Elusimicrobiota bacterium]